MSEDDNSANYIYKLQRHHKFIISGWNSAKLTNIKNPTNSNRYYGDVDI